ncbi:CFI-box-CTERM domain-containing protein, partial [Sansalvadorimonas verongulae]|uniref:CFI-box-CTERM domain-containing protein n=1 Tax=Sansalvadorimonas verongulae TaxID=2172824 RepID=UPI0018AD16D8
NHYSNASSLGNLRKSLQSLAKFLESQNMAHGDIQPGNVMVADAGQTVQLIDYDGIFVNDLRGLGSSELGHRNFQHPKRSGRSWNPQLDRFSFISIDIALSVLISDSNLWKKTQSDGDSILFKANDFADVNQSKIFSDLISNSQFSQVANNFAAICNSDFDKIPALDDFLSNRNIPAAVVLPTPTAVAKAKKYLSAFPVLDSTNYALCLDSVGDKVELIGKVVEVKEAKTRYGKPYIFINFGPWRGEIVKIAIWSEGIKAIKDVPTSSWKGKWVSVTGLMEPPYVSKRYKYSHLAITVTQSGQLHQITEAEAKFRLAGSSTRGVAASNSNLSNAEILRQIQGGSSTNRGARRGSTTSSNINRNKTQVGSATSSPPPKTSSANEDILQKMRQKQAQRRPSSVGTRYQSPPAKKPSSASKDFCFIATAVYGSTAWQTNVLRRWRDTCLAPYFLGRLFIFIYYSVSPHLIPAIRSSARLKYFFEVVLDKIVSFADARIKAKRPVKHGDNAHFSPDKKRD